MILPFFAFLLRLDDIDSQQMAPSRQEVSLKILLIGSKFVIPLQRIINISDIVL